MSELNKLDLNWIDSSNEDQREHFLDALNSYLLFKKDSLDKCNLLIKEEGLGEEGVPNMRLLKKTGKPIKTPYRFLND